MNEMSEKKKFIGLMLRYALPLWKHILGVIVLALVANCLVTMQPLFVSGVIDTVLTKYSSFEPTPVVADEKAESASVFNLNYLGQKVRSVITDRMGTFPDKPWMPIAILLAASLVVVFFSFLFNYCSLIFSQWIRSRTTQMMRNDLLAHLFSLDIGFFYRQKSGELISRVMNDTTQTAQGIGPLVHSIVYQGTLIVIYSAYLFCTNVWLTIGAVGIVLLQFGFTALIKGPLRRSVKSVLNRSAHLLTALQETFSNIYIIKAFSAEGYQRDVLKQKVEEARTADVHAAMVRHIEPNVRGYFDFVALIGVVVIAIIQLVHGSLTVQGFVLFVFVGRLLITPINKFAVNFTWIQAMLASFERLSHFYEELPEVADGTHDIEGFKKSVALKNVHFSYGATKVIDDISFTLEKGEVVAIVGASGAGKSTIVNLILRFFDVADGNICIDGMDIRSLKKCNYRKLFGVVPQDVILFNDTITNNIRFGREWLSDADIVRAAEIANADEFIREQNDGYETLVGDRGVRLSGGQRQRIAIARAVAARPEIIIFDEATSSLDSHAEQQVKIATENILKDSTALLIAHRLATVIHADKIIVLENGTIRAVGAHAELMGNCEYYRNLCEMQFSVPKGSL